MKERAEKAEQLPVGEQHLEGYLQNVPTVSDKIDPLCYWVEQESKYPLLSGLAVDILAIPPASSVLLDMCFLQLGIYYRERNRLADRNQVRGVLLRKNKCYATA